MLNLGATEWFVSQTALLKYFGGQVLFDDLTYAERHSWQAYKTQQ